MFEQEITHKVTTRMHILCECITSPKIILGKKHALFTLMLALHY